MSKQFCVWVNIGILVCSTLDGATAQFTTLFGQGPGQKIMAGVGLAGIVLGSINAGLHASKGSQS